MARRRLLTGRNRARLRSENLCTMTGIAGTTRLGKQQTSSNASIACLLMLYWLKKRLEPMPEIDPTVEMRPFDSIIDGAKAWVTLYTPKTL